MLFFCFKFRKSTSITTQKQVENTFNLVVHCLTITKTQTINNQHADTILSN